MKNILDHLKDGGELIKSGHDGICRVYIQNNKLCDDLIKYGITPNKGHYANPEYIFKNLDKRFIFIVIFTIIIVLRGDDIV